MGAGIQILNNFQTYIINPAIVLLLTAALLLFVYGLVVFIYKLREGTNTSEGVKHMLWGIVGMFIIVSVYGIITMIENFIGSDPRQPDVGRLQNIQTTQLQLFGPPK